MFRYPLSERTYASDGGYEKFMKCLPSTGAPPNFTRPCEIIFRVSKSHQCPARHLEKY